MRGKPTSCRFLLRDSAVLGIPCTPVTLARSQYNGTAPWPPLWVSVSSQLLAVGRTKLATGQAVHSSVLAAASSLGQAGWALECAASETCACVCVRVRDSSASVHSTRRHVERSSSVRISQIMRPLTGVQGRACRANGWPLTTEAPRSNLYAVSCAHRLSLALKRSLLAAGWA